MDETLAPGIRDFLLASSGVIFSNTAREAAEMTGWNRGVSEGDRKKDGAEEPGVAISCLRMPMRSFVSNKRPLLCNQTAW